jgi:hypothetical protein
VAAAAVVVVVWCDTLVEEVSVCSFLRELLNLDEHEATAALEGGR